MSTHMLTTNTRTEDDNQILYKFMFYCLNLNSSFFFFQSFWMYPLFVTVWRMWKEMSFVLLQFVLHEHSVKSKPKGSFQLHNLPPVAESFAGILFRVHVTWYWFRHSDRPMLFRSCWHTLKLWRHGVRPLSVWMLLVFSPSACSRIKCIL